MSVNRKIWEAGWFYHAPPKPHCPKEPVPVPPPSQIVDLGGYTDPPEEAPKMWIKDTDSTYIKLAKQGGRPDLLRMRNPKPKAKEPKSYPKVEWFYHEDNEDTEQCITSEYKSLAPFYMVHEDNVRKESSYQPKRLPYAPDTLTCYERDGSNPTDKTVKLPEAKPAGYGVRAGQMAAKTGKNSANQQPRQNTEDETEMGKVMSLGYLEDWQKQMRADHFHQLRKNAGRPEDKMISEYQRCMTPHKDKNVKKAKAPLKVYVRGNQVSAARPAQLMVHTEPTSSLFKLSKFQNVPARTDSHRIS